ncbi:MAG: hypothetical protein DRJ42_04745 [Deltaproteobacteria bacterium]|nr:MAG: hypothetical protein DRJ42_04745 [Deltaproteobacteria bacterium]
MVSRRSPWHATRVFRLALVSFALTAVACSVDQSAIVPGDTGVVVDSGEDEPEDTSTPDSGSGDTGTIDSGPGCGPGETSCDGTCVDLRTNISHCGSCNNACDAPPADATSTCSARRCGFICDDGFAPDGSGGCAVNVCGDGYLDASEACDDSNMQNGDGCSWDACALEGTPGLCGAPQLTVNRAVQSYRGQIAATDPSGMACEGSGQETSFMLAVNFVGNLTIAVRPAGFDAVLTVYDTNSVPCPGTPKSCGNDGGEGATEERTLSGVTTGEHYLLVVSSANDLGAMGPSDFVIELSGFGS